MIGSDKCEIRLEDTTGKVFGVCAVDSEDSIEYAVDSSRYFVLKIRRGNNHAFIGIGFQERTEAFDFNDALQVFKDRKNRKNVTIEGSAEDYSMKSGEKIKVNFSVTTNDKTSNMRSKPLRSGGLGGLAPPPSSKTRQRRRRNQ